MDFLKGAVMAKVAEQMGGGGSDDEGKLLCVDRLMLQVSRAL